MRTKNVCLCRSLFRSYQQYPHALLSLPSCSLCTHLILGTSKLLKSREFQVEVVLFLVVVVVVGDVKVGFL